MNQDLEGGIFDSWRAAKEKTPDNIAIYEQCVECARAWESGQLPLEGTLSACERKLMWVAINQAEPASDDKRLLQRLLDARVRAEGYVIAEEGLHTRQEVQMWGGVIRYASNPNEYDVVIWPYLTTWDIPPTRTDPGRPGAYVYKGQYGNE